MKEKIKRALQFLLNPRFLLCFGIAWIITNGWAYALLGCGFFLQIDWMVMVASTYLAFLWMPFTPEKLVTVPIAIGLLKWFFPSDEMTLAVLSHMYHSAKEMLKRKKKS